MRRVESATRQDDFRDGARNERLAAEHIFDADRTALVEGNARRERARHDLEVLPLPRGFQAGQPIGQRVGICYNGLRSSPAQIQAEAQRECAPNTLAAPVDTDWYMDTCPLLSASRATFVCTAKK